MYCTVVWGLSLTCETHSTYRLISTALSSWSVQEHKNSGVQKRNQQSLAYPGATKGNFAFPCHSVSFIFPLLFHFAFFASRLPSLKVYQFPYILPPTQTVILFSLHCFPRICLVPVFIIYVKLREMFIWGSYLDFLQILFNLNIDLSVLVYCSDF